MIRVVIVEDKKMVRDGLAALLGGTDGIDCAGIYGDCESMLKRLKQDKPDVILMDIGLPGMSGIEGTREAKEILPDVVIIVLSVYEGNDKIFEAICNGASGYLVKKTPPARLIEAIKEAHEGGSPMTAHIARKVVNLFQKNLRTTSTATATETLTDRETEVLTGLSNGHSYSSVADDLFISVETVRTHIRSIYRKLQVHTQSEAVAKAIRRGII